MARLMCLILVCLLPPSAARAEVFVRVFAATSLQEVLEAAARDWPGRQQGHRVRLVFAASSTLARQIAAGAPADLYISAHPRWMDWLAKRIGLRGRRPVLGNSLVLIAPAGQTRTLGDVWKPGGLAGLLAGRRLAVGDPSHVPAGLYAKAALRRLDLWTELQGRLARAATARAALALVARGEAPYGIVYRSDARAERRVGIVEALPAKAQPRIRYEAALVGGGLGTASFLTWFAGQASAGAFARFGFRPPPARRPR